MNEDWIDFVMLCVIIREQKRNKASNKSYFFYIGESYIFDQRKMRKTEG